MFKWNLVPPAQNLSTTGKEAKALIHQFSCIPPIGGGLGLQYFSLYLLVAKAALDVPKSAKDVYRASPCRKLS
jgi:hypothetical protein